MKPGLTGPRILRGLLFVFALLGSFPALAKIIVSPAAGRQADAFVGEGYGPLQIRISGGTAPYSLQGSTVALPIGMTIDFDVSTSTVTIAGEPAQAGDSFRVDLLITDANNETLQTGGFHIHAQPSRSLFFTPAALSRAEVGRPVEVIYIPQKGQAPYVFQAAGPLPPGLSLDAHGRLSGTPQRPGEFDFQVRLSDVNGSQKTQDYTLQVEGQPPAAAPVTFSMPANAAATEVPLAINGAFDAVEIADPPATGQAEVRGSALFYRPAPGHIGVERFRYRARNAYGVSAPADITVQIVGVIELPSAGDVAFSLPANSVDTPVPLAISGAQPSAVSLASAPSHGRADIRGTGIVYTPAAGYAGTDTFQYRAHLGNAATPAATVTITVVDGLAIPEITGSHLTIVSGSKGVLLPLVLAGGAADRLILLGKPEQGKAHVDGLTLVYEAAAGYIGQDSLTVAAENGAGRSPSASVTLDIVAASTRNYQLQIEQGGMASLTLSAPDLPVAAAEVLALSPSNAGRVAIIADEVQVELSPTFVGQAQIALRLVDAAGAVHEGHLVVDVASAIPALDASLWLLLRTQQLQAHEVARLRANQVAGRQSQLAGGGQGWSAWLDASMGDQRWVPAGDEHRLRGQAFGMDRSGERHHLGVALSHAASRAPLPTAGHSKLAAHGLTAYAGWQAEGLYLDAQFGTGVLHYRAERMQSGSQVSSQRDGRQWQLRLRAGRSVAWGVWTALASFELDGQYSHLSGALEQFPGGDLIHIDGQSSWAVEPALRGRLARRLHWGQLQLTPSWEVALSGRWMQLDGASAHDAGGRWELPVLVGERDQRLGWSHRLGLDLQLAPAWLLRLDYQAGAHEGGQRESHWGIQLRNGY